VAPNGGPAIPRHHKLLLLLVVLAALGSSAAASAQPVPARYRYTGWVSQLVARLPQHMIVVDGSFKLLFNDYANPVGSEGYRVCYARVGGTQHCAHRTLNGVHVDAITRTIHQTGQYIARWYVAGHAVVSWPFLVVQGD
jgi:hypothetical protein